LDSKRVWMAGTRLYRPSTAALRLREESQRPLANKYKYSSVRVMIYSTPRYLCPRFQLSFTRTLESSFFNRLMPHLTGVGVENRRDPICTASLFGLFRSHDLLSIHVESLIIDTKRWLSVVRSFPLLASPGGTTGPGSPLPSSVI